MSECDSSNPVSVIVVVVVVNFLHFRLLFNCCTDLLKIECGCSLARPLPSLLKLGWYPIFHDIMSNFVLLLVNS